jgi:hypothetical protein
MLMAPTIEQKVNKTFFSEESVLHNLVFTHENRFYTYGEYNISSMQETMEHRIIRSRKKTTFILDITKKEEIVEVLLNEIIYFTYVHC